jgi:hypothetical protein
MYPRSASLQRESYSNIVGPVKLFAGFGDSYSIGQYGRDWGHDKQFPRFAQYPGLTTDPNYRRFIAPTQPLIQGAAPVNFARNTVSPFEAFGDSMSRQTDRTWVCIGMGIGGTRETFTGHNWGVGGTSHAAFIAQINQGYADAVARWPGSTFEGIFRWLGANDASLGVNAPTRSAWTSAVQAELDDLTTNLVVGGSSWWYLIGGLLPEFLGVVPPATAQAVELGFRDIQFANSRVYYLPMAEGFNSGDNLHANAAGTRWMGRNMARQLFDTKPAVITSPNSMTVYAGQKIYLPITSDKYILPYLTGADAASFEIFEESFNFGGALVTWQSNRYVLRRAADATISGGPYSVTINGQASNKVVSTQAVTLSTVTAYGTASTGAVTATITQANNAAGAAPYTSFFFSQVNVPARYSINVGVGKNVIRFFKAGADINRVVVNGQDAALAPFNAATDTVQYWIVDSAVAGSVQIDFYATTSGVTASNIQFMVVTLTNTVDTVLDSESITTTPTTSISSKDYSTLNTGGVVLAFGTGATTDTPGATGTMLTTGLSTWLVLRTGAGVVTVGNTTTARTMQSLAFNKAP